MANELNILGKILSKTRTMTGAKEFVIEGKEPVLKYLRAERQRLSAEAAITLLFFVLLSCFFVFGMIWIRQIADGFSDSVYEALTLFSLGLVIFLQLIARVPSLRWVVLGCVIATLFIVMAIAFAS